MNVLRKAMPEKVEALRERVFAAYRGSRAMSPRERGMAPPLEPWSRALLHLLDESREAASL